MARTSAKKASKAKVAKKAVRAKPRKAAKVARKADKRAAPKASRKSAKRAAPKTARKPAKASAHELKMNDIRQRVARQRPGMAPRINPAQQDPSMIPPPQPPQAPVDQLHGNYGDSKARSVARSDNPTNWFRQAPKAKSK